MELGAVEKSANMAVELPALGSLLRYHDELQVIEGCPPAISTAPLLYGYRFAFSDLKHPNNSLPVAKINPSRFVNESPKQCCSGLALSMFSSLTCLQKRAAEGLKTSPKFLKRVGNRFVHLNITGVGRQTEVSKSGHFDFHEYISFNFDECILASGDIFS